MTHCRLDYCTATTVNLSSAQSPVSVVGMWRQIIKNFCVSIQIIFTKAAAAGFCTSLEKLSLRDIGFLTMKIDGSF